MNLSIAFRERIDATDQLLLLSMEKTVLLRILRENTQAQVIQEVLQKIDYIDQRIGLMQRFSSAGLLGGVSRP